jgi:hypothetical protein
MDWPERVIGAAKWTRMFWAAGLLSIPYGLRRPAIPLTVYRGASAERREGMSWTEDVNRAADGTRPAARSPGVHEVAALRHKSMPPSMA